MGSINAALRCLVPACMCCDPLSLGYHMLHLGCLKDKHMHPPRHVADLELVLVVYMSSISFHPVLHSRSGALQIRMLLIP